MNTKTKEKIHVTKTFLPNKEKLNNYIDQIYENNWITNYGPLVKLLEKRLAEFLKVNHVILVSNGTSALEIAYRTLDIKNSAITTPFSFVATTSSLVTNNINPIFCDIHPDTLNINEETIEPLIQADTSAIVPVHTFGNACNIEAIQTIAKKHNLKVIYDACHTFNITYNNQSILNYGDISTLSFHATKLFHTIEGGALIINDDSLIEKARYLINFGIKNQEEIPHLGINAKMNEFEAAMGLCMLDHITDLIHNRKKIHDTYKENLKNYVQLPTQNTKSSQNYAYFPIILENEKTLLNIRNNLNEKNIFPRRYFYPSLDTLNYINPKQECPVSRDISSRILCLPIFIDLEKEDQNIIINTVKHNL